MSADSNTRVHVWVQEFAGRKYLQLQWHDPHTGERKTRTTGTADPKLAENQRADLESALNHGLYGVNSPITWDPFRERVEDEYLVHKRPRTRDAFTDVFTVFEAVCGPKKLRDVTERTVSRFVAGMCKRALPGGKVGLSVNSQKSYLIRLRTALGWAVKQKFLTAVPAFPELRAPKKKPQPVPAEAFDRLLEKAPDDHWRAYLLCGWWAGLRLSEILHLRRAPSEAWPYLDFANNRVVLPAEFAKSVEDQAVPLHPVLREALEGLPDTGDRVFPFRSHRTGLPLTRHGVTSLVRKLAKAAGVKLSMHRLRKGFGCRVAKQLGKGNAPILHTLMRHSNMQVTMDYYASVDDALQDAIKCLT
jgi:integrase